MAVPSRPTQIRFPVDPRDVPPEKAARRLHLTLAQFQSVCNELFVRGFPRPDQTTGMYDLAAIDRWMDERSGLQVSLTPTQGARNAEEVFGERVRLLRDG